MKIEYTQDDTFRQIKLEKLQQQEFTSSFIKFNQHNFQIIKKLQQQKLTHLRKKRNPLQLKQLITKSKVDILKKNFIRKLKRGKIHSNLPQNLNNSQKQGGSNLFRKILVQLQFRKGFDFSPVMLCVWSFINIIQISIMSIIFSIQIAFPQTQNEKIFIWARVFSIFLYVIDMILNFTTQKHEIGVTKKNLKQIGQHYLTHQFYQDFINIAMFPLSYAFNAVTITPFVMIIALVKLKNNLTRFQSFQFIYVKTNTRQLYYSLIKVFLLNFTIGHILSILLNLMASLNQNDQCWYKTVNIVHQPWMTKYIWGYYWGTNIMLTVGFGDLSASNVTEATCLIFIETISCITLAYNISCVGSIISELKAQNEEKKKKLKYFHHMCGQNEISQELQHKVNNFIEETYLIKEQFQLQQYEEVVNSLPKLMQSQYRKQANRSLFNIGFFRSFNTKTIMNLADFVVRKVAHPQQILQRKGEISNLCILQKGCLGLTCRSNIKSSLNGLVKQKIQIHKGQNSKIVSLGFIKRKQLIFDIKSLFYSVYYYLPYDQLVRTLTLCEMDYHFFLFMKDKDDSILGSNEIQKCKFCEDDYHSLFQCPKYHYVPLKENILAKSLRKQNTSKVQRNSYDVDRVYKNFQALVQKKHLSFGQQKYLSENFDEDEVRQIHNIQKYFSQRNFRSRHNRDEIIDLMRNRKDTSEHQYNMIEDILTKITYASIDFWNVECDAAYDFKYYFKESNPNRLIQFKMNPNKKKAKDMIFGVYAFKKPDNPGTLLIAQDQASQLVSHQTQVIQINRVQSPLFQKIIVDFLQYCQGKADFYKRLKFKNV